MMKELNMIEESIGHIVKEIGKEKQLIKLKEEFLQQVDEE